MGTCKDEMTPKTDKGKGIFGVLRNKRKKFTEPANTFADKLADLEDNLGELITVKQTECNTEKGREAYNQKALAHLQTMQYHLDQIVDAAEAYSKLT